MAQTHLELVCPCRVETSNLTSVDLTFGVESRLADRDTGPLRAYLEGRREDGDGEWKMLGMVNVPAIAQESIRVSQKHTVAFLQPRAGTWELRLRVMGDNFRARDSIYWLSEPVSIHAGGGSTSSVHFQGTPTVSIADGAATLDLPSIRNPLGGNHQYELSVALVGAENLQLALQSDPIATHAYDQALEQDGVFPASRISVDLESPVSHDYLQLQIRNGSGRVLAYETVQVPQGESLPVRMISTHDADMLVDNDEDGVSDVNERLMGSDPADSTSTPEDPTIDVLALYSPGFANHHEGEPSTRIRHVLTLADTIFSDSQAGARLRLVGLAEVEVDASHPFNTPDSETTSELIDLHGADIAVMFRAFHDEAPICGWTFVGGVLSGGTGVYAFDDERIAYVFGDCGARTTAHEIGHIMGLGHSFAQGSVGAFRWSRGHGVRNQFVTVMAYPSTYRAATQIDRFSSPDDDECLSFFCGVAVHQPDGADAVTTLKATRFQVANFAESVADSDEDGFVDPVDAFPEDGTEHADFDGDGTGDNADTDDDNDGVEDTNDIFPFDATEWVDTDGDGSGDNGDAFPRDRFESLDSDGDGVGDNSDRFPDDPSETVDTDNDGVGNNADPFPFDTRESLDTDGDGTGDNADTDDDNDGVADVSDHFPRDPARHSISSYRFLVTDGANHRQRLAPAGDIDGDGKGDFLIGLVNYDGDAEPPWSSTAYLVAAADLAAADAADGDVDRSIKLASIAGQPGSWKFVGEGDADQAGHSVSPAGDLDGDGKDEVIIGAPVNTPSADLSGAGAAYIISPTGLAAADAADGETDGVVNLGNIAARDHSWKIIGESGGDSAGGSVGLAGDLDGDGKSELLVGARWVDDGNGALYILSPARLSAADESDGNSDGILSLDRITGLSGSWKLTGEGDEDQVGGVTPSPTEDNAGNAAVLVTAEGHKNDEQELIGAVYLVSSADLASMDAADGASDGAMDLARVATAANSWQFIGTAGGRLRSATAIGDIDRDDVADVFIESNGSAFLVSGADMAGLDQDDDTDGVIRPQGLDAPNSWEAAEYLPSGRPATPGNVDGDKTPDLAVLGSLNAWLVSGTDLAEARDRADAGFDAIPSKERSWRVDAIPGRGSGVLELGLAGDVDGDGLDDAIAYTESNEIFLMLSADLRALDRADADTDGLIDPLQLAGDGDGDGIEDIVDEDDDNDGYFDGDDGFPRDAAEWRDSDDDGVGDNADAFPYDVEEQVDTDGDGTGDNADTDDDNDGVADDSDEFPLDTDDDGTDNARDDDDDGDGVADAQDRFPLDPAESVDTDGDGTGNNADGDDDGDGTPDTGDALPLDPAETSDADGDGTGDNADAFPNDPAETTDTDNDGTGDNADTDDDGDGTADANDVFPHDPDETADGDGDGVGDNGDAFPNDATEWADTDNDGTGDNADTDDDGDEYTDAADLFPLDADRARLFHYRLTGEHARSLAGRSVAMADLDGDGKVEALIGAPGTTPRIFRDYSYGAVYAVSEADLSAADEADGLPDQEIELGRIAAQAASSVLTGDSAGDAVGESLSVIGDLDGDGKSEWLVGAPMAGDGRGETYLVSPADLVTADPLNGADGTANVRDVMAQPGSWVFVGESGGDEAGKHVASAGDVNGDGHADFLIGAPRAGGGAGAAYLVSTAELAVVDSADLSRDGRIDLGGIAEWEGSWKFSGEAEDGLAGWHVASAGDIDFDGKPDLIIGAPYFSGEFERRGAVYLIASADLEIADADDLEPDGVIDLAHIPSQAASWKLVGEAADHFAGWQALTADTDGDGNLELVIGAPGSEAGGAVYIVPISTLPLADDADGTRDGVVDLSQVAALPNAYKLTGEEASSGLFGAGSGAGSALASADFDGDGLSDLVVGAEDYQEDGQWCPRPGEQRQSGAVYVVSGAEIARADAGDGETDGVVRLADAVRRPNSWKLLGNPTDRLGSRVDATADFDGDGRNDLVLGGPEQFRRDDNCGELFGDGVAVMIASADLAEADRGDGAKNGVLDFAAFRELRRAVDFDFDGAEDALDADDDNDGTVDGVDAFPLDPDESADHDFDGTGNNADTDDDNDGALDILDAFPLDPYEQTDTDGDGTGDNADTDDDGDGTADADDTFPLDASETADSDRDGIGDNADPSPSDPVVDNDGDGLVDSEDSDDDNDGVDDADDLFPLNAAKSDLYFYRIAGNAIALNGADFDGDGRDDLAAEAPDGNTYLVSSADLEETDSADGEADRRLAFHRRPVPNDSWRLSGAQYDRIFPAGDVDSDGRDDLIVHDLLVSASSLAAGDPAAGSANDRVIQLSGGSASGGTGIWRLTGSQFDWGVFSLADLNADGRDDLLVGAPPGTSTADEDIDAVYVASGADLPTADVLDGSADGDINLDNLAGRSGSWKIVSESDTELGASIGPAGDVNGDGHADLMIGAPNMAFGTNPDSGSVIVLSGADMDSLDAADEETDGEITIAQAGQDGTWRVGGRAFGTGRAVSAAGDTDGDGLDDVLITTNSSVYLITGATFLAAGSGSSPTDTGSKRFADLEYGSGLGDLDGDGLSDLLLVGVGNAYLISGQDLQGLGNDGGVVDFDVEEVPRKSWRLSFGDSGLVFQPMASVADIDGDGRPELALPSRLSYSRNPADNATYVLSITELAVLDMQDGRVDAVLQLDRIAQRWADD